MLCDQVQVRSISGSFLLCEMYLGDAVFILRSCSRDMKLGVRIFVDISVDEVKKIKEFLHCLLCFASVRGNFMLAV